MSEATVLVDDVAGIRRIQLHRPARRNAIDRPTVEALLAAIAGAVDEDAAVIVLGSIDPALFCSGADLDLTDAERSDVSDLLYALYEAMLTCPCPIIGAVGGPAVGGGAQLVLACDVVVAGPAARLRFPGTGHGVLVGAWALPGIVGRQRATELLLSRRWVGADEAVALGLAQHRADDADADALALAETIAGSDRTTVQHVKRESRGPDLLPRLRSERARNRAYWTGSTAGLVR